MAKAKLLSFVLLWMNALQVLNCEIELADFTNKELATDWIESSDTVREVGKSKASLVIQQTQIFRRGIFFTLLNPQPNGAGFAGVNKHVSVDLSSCSAVKLRIRCQGEYNGYKVLFRHHNETGDSHPSYEQFFKAPTDDFDEVSLDLNSFKAYRRGMELNSSFVLDKEHITSIGLQTYGGVYLDNKQKGVASLEIDWIKAV